jgi:hypothetical protein
MHDASGYEKVFSKDCTIRARLAISTSSTVDLDARLHMPANNIRPRATKRQLLAASEVSRKWQATRLKLRLKVLA